jgi:monomeric sarcosine oxidase
LWSELEQVSGDLLLTQTGLLQVGPRDGIVVAGVLHAAKRHELEVELYTATEAQRRFSGFVVPSSAVAVYEPGAGILAVEACVRAHCRSATNAGADLRSGVTVISWAESSSSVQVRTDQGDFQAEKLVIAPGAWASDLLGNCRLDVQVRRKHIYWFPAAGSEYQAIQGAPAFLYELPQGVFYGLPAVNARGLKCGEHSGGQIVTDPLLDPRAEDPADAQRVQQFISDHLPGLSPQPQDRSVCFYTMSPDEHFLLDFHPESSRVVFAAGLSGHGFKFTSVLGEVLADWALQGETRHPVDFLSLRRLAASTRAALP